MSKYCSKCGNMVNENDNFCVYCRNNLNEVNASYNQDNSMNNTYVAQ